MKRPYFRFLRWFGGLLGGYLVVTAAITTTVDPWRINAAPWRLDAIDGARDFYSNRRVGKAALANRGDWRIVILGSSRVEIALDPAHLVLRGRPAVNLGLSASTLYENLAVGDYALARHPQVETVVLGIDPGDLFNTIDSRRANHYEQSPFADNNHSIERTISQLIGWNALADSVATVRRHATGKPPKFSPLGRMQEPSDEPNLRRFVEAAFIEDSAAQWNQRPQELCQPKVAALAAFIARVRQAGIALHLIIPPQHALKQLHPTADLPASMGWETDLLALAGICRQANASAATGPPVTLWSFLTFNPLTTKPMPAPGAADQRMPGWFDLGHAYTELGDRVLQTLFASPEELAADPAPVGVNLLAGDWEAHRAAWCQAHRDYCRNHPQDVAWWRALVARRAGQPSPPVAEDAD